MIKIKHKFTNCRRYDVSEKALLNLHADHNDSGRCQEPELENLCDFSFLEELK